MATYNNCACCNEQFEQHLGITCCVCKNTFRHSCVKLSTSEIRTINSKKGIFWSCKKCSEMGTDLNSLKAAIVALQSEVKLLQSKNSDTNTAPNTNDLIEDITCEIVDRERRKSNLILFGIPEQDSQITEAARSDKDRDLVSSILQHLSDGSHGSFPLPENMKPIRLGKFSADKHRPIRVNLKSENSVYKIIKQAPRLKLSPVYKNVSIAFDRTPRQIAYYKKLKSELDARIEAGEDNLKIKSFNGQPKIISLNI